MSPAEIDLHAAICQAVALLNVTPEIARSEKGRQAHNILREALGKYADYYMDQPATEGERESIARKHREEAGR